METKLLNPHASRTIRAFLADNRIVDTATEHVFWDCVYANVAHVDHAEALQIARAMQSKAARVESVIPKSNSDSDEE
jgi:hypothetical protein